MLVILLTAVIVTAQRAVIVLRETMSWSLEIAWIQPLSTVDGHCAFSDKMFFRWFSLVLLISFLCNNIKNISLHVGPINYNQP